MCTKYIIITLLFLVVQVTTIIVVFNNTFSTFFVNFFYFFFGNVVGIQVGLLATALCCKKIAKKKNTTFHKTEVEPINGHFEINEVSSDDENEQEEFKTVELKHS